MMNSITVIRIRGYHIDAFGHVSHARYVEFLEEARWEFFDKHRPVVERLHSQGIVHVVAKLELNYRQPANLGDLLGIDTTIKEVERSSVTMEQTICRRDTGALIADAEVVNVFLDRLSGKPISIKEEFESIGMEFVQLGIDRAKEG